MIDLQKYYREINILFFEGKLPKVRFVFEKQEEFSGAHFRCWRWRYSKKNGWEPIRINPVISFEPKLKNEKSKLIFVLFHEMIHCYQWMRSKKPLLVEHNEQFKEIEKKFAPVLLYFYNIRARLRFPDYKAYEKLMKKKEKKKCKN